MNKIFCTLVDSALDSYRRHTFNVRECETLISKNEHFDIVSIRGTEAGDIITGWGWFDIYRDIRIIPWYDRDTGWFHRGFLWGGQGVAKELEKYLDKDKPVYFTGHSMGAAVSLVAAAKLNAKGYNVIMWAGFGGPKSQVTKRKIKGFAQVAFKNGDDIVPQIPRFYNDNYDTIDTGVQYGGKTWDAHSISLYKQSVYELFYEYES